MTTSDSRFVNIEIDTARLSKMNIAQIRADADFAEELGYGDHARKLRECAAAYDSLLTTWAECRDLLSKERSNAEKYRNSILWAVDYFGVDNMSRKERDNGVRQLADVLRGHVAHPATYQPNEWDDSAKLVEKPSPCVKNIHQPDATPAGAVVAEWSGATAGETAHEIKTHVNWLKGYIGIMNEANWRDMRLYCERQLDGLSEALALSPSQQATPTVHRGTPKV